MPEVGEIVKGKELGYLGYNKFIYAVCIDCGLCRWVHVSRGKPVHERCSACSNRANMQCYYLQRPEAIRRGTDNPFYGKHHTKEIRERLSLMNQQGLIGRKGQRNSLEHNTKISVANKKAYASTEARQVVSTRIRRFYEEHPEAREAASERMKKRMANRNPEYERVRATNHSAMMKEWYKNHTHPSLGKKRTKEQRANFSCSQKLRWQNPEYAKRQMRSIHSTPNKKETELQKILNQYFPNEWKFVGSGEIIIGGRCPDFINVNGKKQIIEMFGTHWHQGLFCEAERIECYRIYGFVCLVIWENELKNPKAVVRKVKKFSRVGKHGAQRAQGRPVAA